jgi:quinol-cytochrome oxidoreductase complex cytochrome b subunit
MMSFLEFTFANAWHFFGVILLLLVVLAFIESLVQAFAYRAGQNEEFEVLQDCIIGHQQEIKALKATTQKDREAIADYLNELTKNSK